MKTIIGLGVCFFSLLGAAAAQSRSVITFNLPNAALIGNYALPAGDYAVRTVEPSSGNGIAILNFMGPRGVIKSVFAKETPTAESADSTEVVLKSDGERLHVSKIMLQGRSYDLAVIQ